MPLRPIESQHEETPAFLAERILRDQCLQVSDDDGRVPQLQPRLQQTLTGHGAKLGQPNGLGLDPGLTQVLGVRRAAPQP